LADCFSPHGLQGADGAKKGLENGTWGWKPGHKGQNNTIIWRLLERDTLIRTFQHWNGNRQTAGTLMDGKMAGGFSQIAYGQQVYNSWTSYTFT